MRGRAEKPIRKPLWKRVLILCGIGFAGFLLLMLLRGGFLQSDPAQRWQTVSDALFVPGILMASMGLLVAVSDGGVFDMLRFGLQKVFSLFRRKEKRDALPKTFYDYRVERDARAKAPIGALLAVGTGMIVLAGIALYFYSQYAPLL